jgi:short-subunit dehydrogenase
MSRASRSRVIVITGASDGIGAELAVQLAARGHELVLAARNEAALQAVAAACSRRGGRTIVVPTDVAAEDDCRRLTERALEAFGRLDVLVSNAGISMDSTFDDITDWSTFEQLWRVNCLGTINCTRFAWPYLKRTPSKRGGQIVGIGSLAGRTGVPHRTAYCASKFAQTGFLEALRIEAEEHGIKVTIIYPGMIATGLHRDGLNGRGQPADVTRADEATRMPVDKCARRIVRAIERRRREVVMTANGRLGLWLKLIAPRWVDNLARRAQRKEQTE